MSLPLMISSSFTAADRSTFTPGLARAPHKSSAQLCAGPGGGCSMQLLFGSVQAEKRPKFRGAPRRALSLVLGAALAHCCCYNPACCDNPARLIFAMIAMLGLHRAAALRKVESASRPDNNAPDATVSPIELLLLLHRVWHARLGAPGSMVTARTRRPPRGTANHAGVRARARTGEHGDGAHAAPTQGNSKPCRGTGAHRGAW